MKAILFNGDMVRAILDGRKTVTRRAIKPQPESFGKALAYVKGIYSIEGLARESPYQIGDVLWVQETWRVFSAYPSTFGYDVLYKADECIRGCIFKDMERYFDKFQKYENKNGWQSPYFMPKEAARIFLKVTNVRVERLQKMYVDDAIKEGAWGGGIPSLPFSLLWKEHPTASCIAIASFAHLWDSTIKKQDLDTYGWDANPWVWVIEFERISKEAAE